MKKKIILSIFVLLMVITLTGCKSKTPLNPGEFKIQMQNKNYTVQDATNQFSSNPEIKQVYIALNSNYQIEYYEIDTEENAKLFYKDNRTIFEQSKGNTSTYTTKEYGNYQIYKLKTNGKYKVIARIGNTAIYLDVDNTYKSEIDSILDYLGY